MASGSSGGRADKSASKGSFDFASDDILCSYEDYDDRKDPSNGNHSDPVIGTNFSKDLEKSRILRSSMFPPTNIYTHHEVSVNQELISTVENTMKRYTDTCMRFLEGMSSRLSQLELYCYNLDKSIREMRTELAHDNKEADGKLKSMDKHIQEVHMSVQILRDKQELADTQKELTKLQLAQKESFKPQQEEKSVAPASESKKSKDGPEMHSQQLALALPHQMVQQPSLPTRSIEQQLPPVASSQMTPQNITQLSPYYLPATQLPNPAAQPPPPQGPYAPPADPQYRPPQMSPNPQQGQVNQPPQVQQYPQYQQQWPQPPVQQQPAQPHQVPSQTQIRAPPLAYPTYLQNQPPHEQLTVSMPMQMPTPQQGLSRADVGLYGYSGPGRPHQTQTPPPPMKGGDEYAPPSGSYMMYEGSHHPPQTHFSQNYQQANTAHQNPQIRDLRLAQFPRSHPYNEVIEKLVSMGYKGDHAASVIQRLEETRQPVDFNTVLDRLNGHSSGGGSQRSW